MNKSEKKRSALYDDNVGVLRGGDLDIPPLIPPLQYKDLMKHTVPTEIQSVTESHRFGMVYGRFL